MSERVHLVQQVADCVGNWGFCRMFVECIDKVHFDPLKTGQTISEQAFTQIVSRFEQFLEGEEKANGQKTYGMLVHDNNETVAHKHTEMMRLFQRLGTKWHSVDHIMETPLFVDSRLTRMVQVADLCSYAIRRYEENNEVDLFSRVFPRAHRLGNKAVGARHYTKPACTCEICMAHR